MKFKEKTALVTGASKGIGKEIAISLAKEGSSVIVNFNNDERSAKKVLNECDKYSKGNFIYKCDVSVEEEVKNMIDLISKRHKKLDILVNNAGIFDETDRPENIEAFKNIFSKNFLSCVLVTKYSLSLMKQGKIVNISSIHGRLGHGSPEAIAYSSLKAAMDSYTKNLAKELAPEILVNAIAPGRVATPMWGSPDKKEQLDLGRVHLIKRMIQPEEIAESLIYLVRNDAVCGEILTVDGGMSLVTLG